MRKILASVIAPNYSLMAEAQQAVPEEFDDELMEPEPSETDAPSPSATVNSPTTVIAVLAPTESTITQLCRLQAAFRRRRELAPAAKVFQRLWRARQKRHGALHAGSVRARISAHLLPLLKSHTRRPGCAGLLRSYEFNVLFQCIHSIG